MSQGAYRDEDDGLITIYGLTDDVAQVLINTIEFKIKNYVHEDAVEYDRVINACLLCKAIEKALEEKPVAKEEPAEVKEEPAEVKEEPQTTEYKTPSEAEMQDLLTEDSKDE